MRVELDPVINLEGRLHHPDQPYANPKVAIHLDDGRSFVRQTRQTYDLIGYALVDSLRCTRVIRASAWRAFCSPSKPSGHQGEAEAGWRVRNVQLLPAIGSSGDWCGWSDESSG